MKRKKEKVKTIRDYPLNRINPFETESPFISKDKSFSVNVVENARSLTGIHKIKSNEALDIVCLTLKEKLGLTKVGVNIFRFLYLNPDYVYEAKDMKDANLMAKINFEECREEMGYTSTQSVWCGLAELLNNNIIARAKVSRKIMDKERGLHLHYYHLNPIFFLPTKTIVVTEYYKVV